MTQTTRISMFLSNPLSLILETLLLVVIPISSLVIWPEFLQYRLIILVLGMIYIFLISRLAGFTRQNLGVSYNNFLPALKSISLLTLIVIVTLSIGFIFTPEIIIVKEMTRITLGRGLILDLLFYALISVSMQELIFRGYVINRLALVSKNKAFIILYSALLFAVIHIAHDNTIIFFAFTYLIGGWYTAEFLKHRNLIPIIISHGLIGVTALTFMRYLL